MSDIALHQQAIAGIFEGFTGLKKAFEIAPSKLDTAELPALYTLTGSGNDSNQYGESEEYTSRTYRIQIAVIPIGQATPEIRETLCRDLMENVRRELKRYPSLDGTEGVERARVIGDSGIVILPEFGMKFVGFEIRLQVTYSELIEFAENE